MLGGTHTHIKTMNYMIRQPKSENYLGPYSLAEISSQLQSHTITDDYEAHESSGQSYTVLRHSDDWASRSRLFEQMPPSPTTPPPTPVGDKTPVGSNSSTQFWSPSRIVGLVFCSLGAPLMRSEERRVGQ